MSSLNNFSEFSEFHMDGDMYRNFCPGESMCVETEFPVYRSVAVSQQLFEPRSCSDIDMPQLTKEPKPAALLVTSIQDDSFSEFESFDFFEAGEAPPPLEALGFCPLACTNFCVSLSADSVVETLNAYLNDRDICIKYISGNFRWVCEVERNFENVKFEIQLYTSTDGIIVEFQRLRGSSIIFSKLFRDTKSDICDGVRCATLSSPRSIFAALSPDICCAVSSTDMDTCSVVEWIRCDPVEGVKVLCEMISGNSIDCDKNFETVRDACSALVSRELQSVSAMPILSLARCLVHMHKQQTIPQVNSLLEILIPSVARNGCATLASDYIVKYSADVMESVSKIYVM